MTDQPTLATLTEDQLADLIQAATAWRNQPSLRNCIYPGCLREFDMAARMNGREPARPSWSGDGWHQVGGVSPGHICPNHVDTVAAHLARPVDVPNGRWMVACACGWMSRPQTYGGLLRPLWEEHLLYAAGELTAPVTLAETPGRLPLPDHTETSLRELYDALEDTEHDRAETREAAQAMYKAWDWHRHTLAGAARAVTAVCNMMRTSSDFLDRRDWTADRIDAYLWAVLIGWDDEVLQEIAAKHRWNEHRVKYVREMRALLAPITDQPKEG
ncbi:hypothetical protein [Streptomyces glaucescens]|uniref:hypothetical protein n=2 Tax=Streptomyces TaxID=1883 RepID=UPI000A36505D|nr:hypothetical protein [Streptomyces glaucescens]